MITALVIGGALLALLALGATQAEAQTVTTGNYQFNWESPISQINGWAAAAAGSAGVPAAWVKAIIYIESRGNPSAVNPSDPSYGLMALEIPTAEQMAGATVTRDQLLDAQFNADLGAKYLAWLSDLYSGKDFSEWADAYNVGPGAYDAGERSHYGADVREISTGETVFLTPAQLAEAFG